MAPLFLALCLIAFGALVAAGHFLPASLTLLAAIVVGLGWLARLEPVQDSGEDETEQLGLFAGDRHE
jgi:hypothetical protein